MHHGVKTGWQWTVPVRELPVPVYGAPYGSQPLRLWAPTVQTGTVVPYPLKIGLGEVTKYLTRGGQTSTITVGYGKMSHLSQPHRSQIWLRFV